MGSFIDLLEKTVDEDSHPSANNARKMLADIVRAQGRDLEQVLRVLEQHKSVIEAVESDPVMPSRFGGQGDVGGIIGNILRGQ